LRGKDQKRAERARSLRRALTPAEFALWERIRARQLGGFKFVRQEPVDRYAPPLPPPLASPRGRRGSEGRHSHVMYRTIQL